MSKQQLTNTVSSQKTKTAATTKRSEQQPAPQPSAVTKPVSAKQITQECIAARAYQLWQNRNYAHGHDMNDWLEAERQLRQQA